MKIAIIGAGIAGLGVAELAVEKGWQVTIYEKATVASQTSKNSLRIIHSGFRYLQNLNFKRVIESKNASNYLKAKYPEYIKDLYCFMPTKRFGLKSYFPLSIASKIYNFISKDTRASKVLSKIPDNSFKELFSSGALFWVDGLIYDLEGFINKLVSNISENNRVKIFENTEVKNLLQSNNQVLVEGIMQGEIFSGSFDYVVNASGYKTEDFKNRAQPVKWLKAYNLILKKPLKFHLNNSICAYGLNADGKTYFFVPREKTTVIGTEYKPFEPSTNKLEVTTEEISEFVTGAQKSLKGYDTITFEDVDKLDVGVIPERFGSDEILQEDKIIHLLTKKYTTFLETAKKVIEKIDKNK